MLKLRSYQQQQYNEAIRGLKENDRLFLQLSTGGGKTIIFSELANKWNGNVLILVNRTELIQQTARNINRTISLITAKTKQIGYGEVKIGMVETVYNRIEIGLFNLNNIDLIIIDEAHNLQFTKVVEDYKGKLIAVSATPVIMKKEKYFKCKYCEKKDHVSTVCCGKETDKYTKQVSLSEFYGKIIVGIDIEKLIEKGFLTPAHNFSCDAENLKKLETDSTGDFSSKSQNEVFNNSAGLDNLIANYELHAEGLKTMVFNSNIQANEEAYKAFLALGYNVRSYDSKSKTKRKEVVRWFENTPNAILMSVGVFTTGFDVSDVQCIILNKATTSLSLFHQIVGRGGRITDKIYKPFFKCIDLGGNIDRFGSWSDPVDWKTLYYAENERKTRVNQLEDYKICHSCDAMIMAFPCEFCGAIEQLKKKSRGKITLAEERKPLPPINLMQLLRYCEINELSINDGKNFTANYLLDMLIFSQTKKTTIEQRKEEIKIRILKAVKPVYFALHGSKLEGNRYRTINDFCKKVEKKIFEFYEKR